jgi:uncharacterized damage-inducible protein DinB
VVARVLVITALAAACASAPAIAQRPQAAPDLAAGIRAGFEELSGFVMRTAELVPEAQLDYRPVATVRTVRQMLAHIADGNNYYCGRARGRNTEWSDALETGNLSRAQLIERLRESVAACVAAHAGAARPDQLLANLGHVAQHYGNLVTYLRMLGLTPPSS